MLCPECGMENIEGSMFCSNCGARLVTEEMERPLEKREEKEKGKGKSKVKVIAVVAVAAVVVVVIGLITFGFGDETDRANELVEMANREIGLGNEHLNAVSVKLAEFREINFDLTIESAINQEIQYASGWKQDSLQLKTTIGRVKEHFEKAKGYYKDTEDLRLPGWYHEYIGLKVKALEKDLERMSKIEALLGNYVLYYGFAESYLRGEMLLMDVQDELDEGNSYLSDGNYSAAVDSFRDALSGLRDSQEEFVAAGEVIDLDFMDDLEEYLDGLGSALEALMQATQFLNLGNLLQANTLLDSANVELATLELPEGLMEEGLESWYDQHIEGLIEEIEELLSEVKQLEEEAKELYEENA